MQIHFFSNGEQKMIEMEEMITIQKRFYIHAALVLLLIFIFTQSKAQICKGKCKFLGNIIANSTPSNSDTYWNQVTPENASKLGSIEILKEISIEPKNQYQLNLDLVSGIYSYKSKTIKIFSLKKLLLNKSSRFRMHYTKDLFV